LNNKLSDKDKKDWQNFINSGEKIQNKDLSILSNNKTSQNLIKKIDLHGYSLENANKTIEEFINKCFLKNIEKIIVITGKGKRSNNASNPYVSNDLSILKNSVPEFIKNNENLMKMIKYIKQADIKEGGSGAFNIYLKKFKE
tara:strand:+ start:2465 stop:2890 length:426 start_codon:yes stop_codon:yes gene_type:complete